MWNIYGKDPRFNSEVRLISGEAGYMWKYQSPSIFYDIFLSTTF